jgi:sulfite exporter TauE/SafE/copper chaperone CopZ
MVKEIIKIKGMTCNNCVKHIEDALRNKVNNVKANFIKGDVKIDYHSGKISKKRIISIIESCGYSVKFSNSPTPSFNKSHYIAWGIVIVSVLVLVYFLYGMLDRLNLSLPEIGEKTSLLLLFLLGLLTGFHCVSMCGGFVVSYTTKNAQRGKRGMKQHVIYGLSKTASYTIIGGLFGLIGSVFLFTPTLRGSIAVFAGLFMIAYSLSMLGFKFFRRFQFNAKFLSKIASSNKGTKFSGPMVTGLLNGLFIACGPLQAMYIYAAGTGSVIQGALSLMAFGFGTLPVLMGFGGLTNIISYKATRKILKISAIVVLILGIIMLNRGLALTGSGYDVNSIISGVGLGGITGNFIMDDDGYQVIEMHVVNSGYVPNSFTLKKGVPVRWIIYGDELTGCNNAIQVPNLNLEFDIKKGKQVIEFTAEKEGVISWSCWMGMISGTFIVTEDEGMQKYQIKSETEKTSGSCGGSCGSSTCDLSIGSNCGCGGSK